MSNNPSVCHLVSSDNFPMNVTPEEAGVPQKPDGPKLCQVDLLDGLIKVDGSENIDNEKVDVKTEKDSEQSEVSGDSRNPNEVSLNDLIQVDTSDKNAVMPENDKHAEKVVLHAAETPEDRERSGTDSENTVVEIARMKEIRERTSIILAELDSENDDSIHEESEISNEISGSETKVSLEDKKKKKRFFPKSSRIGESLRSKFDNVKRGVVKYSKLVGESISSAGRRLFGPPFNVLVTGYAIMLLFIISIFVRGDSSR